MQGTRDKAEPGKINFSSVSLEGSRPPRGIQQGSILVWLLGLRIAEGEAILTAMNSGVSQGAERFPGPELYSHQGSSIKCAITHFLVQTTVGYLGL